MGDNEKVNTDEPDDHGGIVVSDHITIEYDDGEVVISKSGHCNKEFDIK